MNSEDLKRTEKLFDFLQGCVPEGYKIHRKHVPKLTPDQAWTVIWYLGNQYWQVTDYVDRCDVCGALFDTRNSGGCLDYGRAPYSFCDSCWDGEAYIKKSRSRLNPENKGKARLK